MWPKNEYERATRVPRKQSIVNGQRRDSVWHQVGLRNLKTYYTNGEEFERPMLQEFYEVGLLNLNPRSQKTGKDSGF